MNLKPRIHDIYVARTVLGSVLLTWAVLVGLDVTLGLVDQLSDVGKGRYGYTQALLYTALTVPNRLYELFPTTAVIGALMALGQLAATSELTALRAVGLSRRRIGLGVAGAIALLTGLMVVNGETLGPMAQHSAESLKAGARSDGSVVARYSGLWAREGEFILNAGGGEEKQGNGDRWLELRDVRLYEFAGDGRLVSQAHAAVAEHRPGAWLLRDVNRIRFEPKSVSRTHLAEERWASKLDSTALTAGLDKPRYLASNDLRKAVDYRKRNSLDASEFEKLYWGRWFYPINVLALCLAAIPFAFGTLRSGGLGKRLFIGIVFALGFWLLQTQFVNLAGVFKFDYRLAYVAPTLIMLAVSAALFRRRSG